MQMKTQELTKNKYFILELFVLLLIFLVALFVRVKLTLNSEIWADEVVYILLPKSHSFTQILSYEYWDKAHPPLFYLFFKMFLFFFPDNPNISILRIPGIFFSSLAVFPIYYLTKKVVKNPYAFFAPLWYSIHSYIILHGYSFGPYGILQFLFPLLLLLYFENIKRKRYTKLILWLLLLSLFWNYASVWLLAVLLSHQIYLKKHFLKNELKNFTKNHKLFLLFVTFWLVRFFFPSISEGFTLNSHLSGELFPLIFPFSGLSGVYSQNYVTGRIPVDYYLLIPIIILLIHNIETAIREKIKNYFLLGFFALSPLFVAYIFTFLDRPILSSTNQVLAMMLYPLLFTPLLNRRIIGLLNGVAISYILCVSLIRSTTHFSGATPNIDILVPYNEVQKLDNKIVLTDASELGVVDTFVSYAFYLKTHKHLNFDVRRFDKSKLDSLDKTSTGFLVLLESNSGELKKLIYENCLYTNSNLPNRTLYFCPSPQKL